MIDHSAFQELAAGSVLDDLDPGERQRLDEHLAGCAACRSMNEQLDDLVWDLALLTPDMAPPQSLHRAVFDALHAIDAVPVVVPAAVPVAIPAAATSSTRRDVRTRWTRLVPLALAAAIGIVAIGLGTRVTQLTQETATAIGAAADAQAQVDARDGAMAVIVSAGHRTAELSAEALAPNAIAMAVFEPGTTESYVVVSNLPATPAGHVYQLWYADAAGVHPLGTYRHGGTGTFVARFGVDLRTSAAAMITLEPDGGAVGEPGPQAIFGTL